MWRRKTCLIPEQILLPGDHPQGCIYYAPKGGDGSSGVYSLPKGRRLARLSADFDPPIAVEKEP